MECNAFVVLCYSNTSMPPVSRLTLALAIAVLCTGCAEGLSNLPWTNTETTMSSKKVRAPNGGRWGTLETTTTCNTYYIGSTAQRRECGVSEKYVPPPERKYSGGMFEQLAKGMLDSLVGGIIDEAIDELTKPKAPPASDMPSNMTVLPPAEAAREPATPPHSADDAPLPTP